MAEIALGTKAETLERLGPAMRSAEVLPISYFTLEAWRRDRKAVISGIMEEAWSSSPLIVRSSTRAEDSAESSHAGQFLTVGDVRGDVALAEAIESVAASFSAAEVDGKDQILVQRYLENVSLSGVAFSRDQNTGAHYVVVNYDSDGDTDAVTGGGGNSLNTFVALKGRIARRHEPDRDFMNKILDLVDELERLTGNDSLDIEFAFDAKGTLYLFQVRPLVLKVRPTLSRDEHESILRAIADKISLTRAPHPYLHGKRTVFGVMPDWNPAEIIGVRPRPLALSLYRELVTDSIWAYQRNNYGYKNLRSFPLMLDFHGLPYIDVRVSFNSFLASEIESPLAEKLIDYYIDRLIEEPILHDKIEFEIIFSCYTFDLPRRLKGLESYGFDEHERRVLADSLLRLTNRIIHAKTGLWRADIAKIDILEERQKRVLESDMDTVSKIYWLIEDCKRYGTLPFAGLARAGFIAMQMLNSLVDAGILSEQDKSAFLSTLRTVGSRMGSDFQSMERREFLARYGHLRPGTYDILSARYDEAPNMYFDWKKSGKKTRGPAAKMSFKLTPEQTNAISRLIREHGLVCDVDELFEFMLSGIEGREHAKFIFSKSLSEALVLIRKLGESRGFSASDMSFSSYGVIPALYATSADPEELLPNAIAQGMVRYSKTSEILLPPLITDPGDVWSFYMPPSQPNFVTLGTATGPVRSHRDKDDLEGAIVMIPSADPGFDWIFSRGIIAFVTAYGGANSHMAIRANELGLPAIIGAGEVLFNKWSRAEFLHLDCASRQARILR